MIPQNFAMDAPRRRFLVSGGVSRNIGPDLGPEDVHDWRQVWSLDLDTYTWSRINVTRDVSLKNTAEPTPVYSAWGGVDQLIVASGEGRATDDPIDTDSPSPSRWIIGGGWNYEGKAVSRMYVIDLRQLGQGALEWTELALPFYMPFVDESSGVVYDRSTVSSRALLDDPEDDPFAIVLDADGIAGTSDDNELRLLGGSASWVTDDGRTIFLLGGCIKDLSGRMRELYGRFDASSDNSAHCHLRNPVRITLPLGPGGGMARAERGSFSVLPTPCMGARKYASMSGAIGARGELVIFGGEGSLDWYAVRRCENIALIILAILLIVNRGDGEVGSVGVLQPLTGDFLQFGPGLVRQQSFVPLNSEGQVSFPFVGSSTGLAGNYTGTVMSTGGYTDNQAYARRVWLLRRDVSDEDMTTKSHEVPCTLRTYPNLALLMSLPITRLITIHGVLMFLVFAVGPIVWRAKSAKRFNMFHNSLAQVFIPADIFLLLGVSSKRRSARVALGIAKENREAQAQVIAALTYKQSEWVATHRALHVISLSIVIVATFLGGAVFTSGLYQMDMYHFWAGSITVFAFAASAILGIVDICTRKSGDKGPAILSESFERSLANTAGSPAPTCRPLTYAHRALGFVTYGGGVVAIAFGIVHSISSVQLFYALWISIATSAIIISLAYRHRALHAVLPGFRWIDRRFLHIANEYRTRFQSQRPIVDTFATSSTFADKLDGLDYSPDKNSPSSLPSGSSGSAPVRDTTYFNCKATARPAINEADVSEEWMEYQRNGEILSRLTAHYSSRNAGSRAADASGGIGPSSNMMRGANGRFASIRHMLRGMNGFFHGRPENNRSSAYVEDPDAESIDMERQ